MSNKPKSDIEDYPYQNNIRRPDQLSMSDRGTMPQLGRNIDALEEYVKILVSGNSRASSTGGPLGNKYFLKTGSQCKAVDTCKKDNSGSSSCEEADRYIYINNVPTGNIPFISSGMNVNFTEFRGLIPGSIEALNVLDPSSVFRAFSDGGTPSCQVLQMQTIDNNNNSSSESHYVTLSDIKSMNPCWFGNNTNPITNEKCKTGFTTLTDSEEIPMSNDPIDQLYFVGLACVGIYMFYRIMEKAK